MASASLVPKNGAVSLSYGTNTVAADFNSFDIGSSQVVENVTPYGANTCTKNVGNGTPDFDFTIQAFALKGASGTAPSTITGLSGGTASATFTLDTSCTLSGSLMVQSIRLSHGRMKAAVGLTISAKNAGDITESWSVS